MQEKSKMTCPKCGITSTATNHWCSSETTLVSIDSCHLTEDGHKVYAIGNMAETTPEAVSICPVLTKEMQEATKGLRLRFTISSPGIYEIFVSEDGQFMLMRNQ